MIANALVPIFFGLLMGYWAGRRRIVDNRDISGLNTFLLNYALPAALLLATARTPRQALREHTQLFVVLALLMVLTFLLWLLIETRWFKLPLADSAACALTMGLPNWVAIGLPLFLTLYGPERVAAVAVAIVCGNVVTAPLTLVLLEAGTVSAASAGPLKRFAVAAGRAARKPIIIGPLIGVYLSLAGWVIPPIWVRSLDLFAQATAGIALFITGLVLSRESISLGAGVISGLALKTFGQPLLAYVIAAPLMHCPTQVVRDAVLLAACPAGFLGLLFGVAYKTQTREAGSLLLLSSASCAITLSVVLLLLPFIS